MINPPLHSAPNPIHEAIQHHMDRLQSNQTRSAFASTPPRPGSFNPRSFPITGKQDGGPLAKAAHWLFPHSPLQHFQSNVHSTGRDIAQTFDPRSKQGLVNLAGMFVPGRAGEVGNMPKYDLAQHYPIGEAIAPKDTTGRPIAMRVLTNRAQGAGRYNRPQGGLAEMARIEALRKEQSRIAQTNDKIKDYANDSGFLSKQSNMRMRMNHAFEDKTGGALDPYSAHQGVEPIPDFQSRDYTNRMRLLNLQKQMPGNELLGNSSPIMRAIWDMLFGGKGLPNPPARP